MSTLEAEREAFEKWAIDQDMNITRGLRGEYSYMEPAYAWRVWQARASITASTAEPVAGEYEVDPALIMHAISQPEVELFTHPSAPAASQITASGVLEGED